MQLQAEVERLRIVVAELSAENLQFKKGLSHRQAVLLNKGEDLDPQPAKLKKKEGIFSPNVVKNFGKPKIFERLGFPRIQPLGFTNSLTKRGVGTSS